jgi:cysteine desulfurase family protein
VDGTHLNAGRNFEGLETGAIALRARRAIGKLFGVSDPLRTLFTGGATQSLNMALHGLLRPGDHVLATGVEHNATARPLEALRAGGMIALDWLRCDPDGSLESGQVRGAIRKNTRLLVMTHASNVLGTILPVAECFKIAHERGVFTVLDMAQTGGVLPFVMEEWCDAMAFAGHKGLGALAGIGGLVLGEAAGREMRPWLSGGTGSVSDSLAMPDFLPDKFEPGTQNTIGILSLAASVEELVRAGVGTMRTRERGVTARFLAGLGELKNIRVYGTGDADRSVAVVSLAVRDRDAGEVSQVLFERHGIITRSGLHCSPLAHKTAGTFPGGTVRFSFGRGTTEAEIDALLAALEEL